MYTSRREREQPDAVRLISFCLNRDPDEKGVLIGFKVIKKNPVFTNFYNG